MQIADQRGCSPAPRIREVREPHRHPGDPGPASVENPVESALDANLSAQEHRVLLALAAGRRTGEIAAELNLSGKTISTYKRRVLNKLGLQSTADLVRYVIEHKLS